jgi:hypothetical protein
MEGLKASGARGLPVRIVVRDARTRLTSGEMRQ